MSHSENSTVVEPSIICFNYSAFLSASCKKRWRFIDAIYGVLPIFGMVTRKSTVNKLHCNEQFKELALQIISTQVSDEINIARLITLASQLSLANFKIRMPYPLSEKQVSDVYQEYNKPLTLIQHDDHLEIKIPA